MRCVHDNTAAGTGSRFRRWIPAPDPQHRYPRVTSARVLATVFDIAVGLRLLWPDDSLGSSEGYRYAETHFLGDVGLGGGLLLMGLVMGTSLYTDRIDKIAGAVTLLALATWVLFAYDLLLVNGSQIGTFAYGILAAGVHGYALAHLLSWRDQQRRDARRADANSGAA